MAHVLETRAEAVDQEEMDRELRMVDAAISMVRLGAAVRVTVANLRPTGAVLDAAQARACLHHLRVTAAWAPGGEVCALVVEHEPRAEQRPVLQKVV